MRQEVVNALTLGAVYNLFAVGLSLIWGSLKVLNIAHGSILMFAAFLASRVAEHANLNIWEIGAIGIATGAAISVFLEWFAFAPIRRKITDVRDAEMAILIASIAASGVLVAIAEKVTLNNPFGFPAKALITEPYHFGGFEITNVQVITVVLSIASTVGIATLIKYSKPGRALRAIAHDPAVASLMGINESMMSLITFLAAGALAGLAGVLFTEYLGGLDPLAGNDLILKGFAVVVIGGVGSTVGTFIGAYVLAGCEVTVIATTNGQWTDAVSFGLIILIIVCRPRGLLGRLTSERI
jgi:branched-chain amino acid transport system permease protein